MQSNNSEFKGKRLLFIGASGHFELAIKKAKEMGIYTIIINYNKMQWLSNMQIWHVTLIHITGGSFEFCQGTEG